MYIVIVKFLYFAFTLYPRSFAAIGRRLAFRVVQKLLYISLSVIELHFVMIVNLSLNLFVQLIAGQLILDVFFLNVLFS